MSAEGDSAVADPRSGTNDLWEAMYTQRAIRYFKPDPVSDELVWKVIEAATRAPSGSNLQPWRFIVIQDQAARKRIADKLRETAAPMLTLGSGPGSENPDKSFRLMRTGARHLAEEFDSAPVYIVPCLYHVRSPVP